MNMNTHHLATLFVVALAISGPLLAEEARGFAASLIRVEMDRPAVIPGGEIAVTVTMANLGDQGSTLPLRMNLEATEAGKAGGLKMSAQGEPFPPTTLWSRNAQFTFGFALSVPAQAIPGDYDVSIFLRPKDGGDLSPMAVGGGKSEDVVPLGRVTVLPTGSREKPGVRVAKYFSPAPSPAQAARRAANDPGTLRLATGEIEITLDADKPVIRQAGHAKQNALGADAVTGCPEFRIFRKSDGAWFSSASSNRITTSYRVTAGAARVAYRATILCDSQPAVECDLFFTLAGNELRIGFENVRQQEDFILTTISWPRLLAGNSPDTRLVNGRFSGRLMDPARCIPGTVTHESTWIDPYVGGVLYSTRVLSTVGIDSPGDLVTTSIGRDGDISSAGFGLEFTHYIAARGAPWERWILAAGTSMARLRFIERTSSEPALTWVDGAKLLREEVANVRPPAIYQDSVIYKILMDSKDYKDLPPELPATSFAQAREIMSEVRLLTDGLRQIAYLTGAQHEGQDTKYPDVFTTNPKLGTTDELINLIRDGRDLNTVVSFHSCATEAYKDSPMWDEKFIARDPSGGLFIYNRFAGGDCYWINQDQFARRGMGDLITRIFSTYPIVETYHIDVLSTRAANVDFNPANPCSPNAGYAGRLRMVDEFNRHGIDLTSEGLISWFVGKIGHAWLLKCESMTSLLGEEQIPFVPMIYHGHATYGLPSELNPLLGILYGATFSMDFMPFDRMKFLWPGHTLSDSLYLQNFPFQMLRNREMQNYDQKGNVRRVTYDADTFVEIEVSPEDLHSYRGYRKESMGKFHIVVDGRTVARDFTAFLPGPRPGTYLAYSRFGGKIEYEAPAGWNDGTSLKVESLGTGNASASLAGGRISLDLPTGVPVRVSLQ